MIFISKYLVPNGYYGFTFFPFVFLKSKQLKKNKVLLNHEKIHLKQQLEMIILPFYMVYITEFVIRLFQYKDWNKAYRNISFEREAYINEANLDYLTTRKFWSFLKYLCNHDI
ncbi:hypothetical protein L3X39_08070 [Sabulilitoribacter multivorans]|uniref:Peptidase M56 domain-containing protein n=1 Tax=Flaviramulus multivorans TaxID=1304750 RepID=A0ABS9IIK6_9FLAO|nr:hypothetical protein [Flaviramulus multivorans]MCF7560591.1 hypothetical protein [Flaviramulus multivorans]